MTKEYNIGDKVYWAKYERIDVRKKCPVCFGKKGIIVILGNDEKVKIECDYCNVGLSSATGYIKEYDWVSDISEIIIDGKEINENLKGKFIEYRYGCYILRNDDIFIDKKDAEKRVKEKIKEAKDEEDKRYQSVKGGKIMKLSWSIGYHRKEIKQAEKNLAYHSSKVEIVKDLIKNKSSK